MPPAWENGDVRSRITQNKGGTFCARGIARNRPHRGDLRRAQSGGQRRAAAGVHSDCPAQTGTPDQRHRGPFGPCRWRLARAQGAHPRARHGGGRIPHRPRRHPALGGHRVGARSPGDGAVDPRYFSVGLHLRPHPSARPGAGRDPASGGQALRGGGGGPGAPDRGHRRAVHAIRLGLLVQHHHRLPGTPGRGFHDGRQNDQGRGRGGGRDRGGRLDPRSPTPPAARPKWPSAITRDGGSSCGALA
jgi:hypothetical protein